MDEIAFGSPLGGAHLHRLEPESGDRLRYIKTAEQGNAKWVASTSIGEDTWANNLNSTQKPITQAAVDARGKMQSNFQTATAPGGPWERHLLARGDGYVKSQATKLKANYTTGVRGASDKQLAALRKIIAYETSMLTQLTPKSASGSGRTRMNEWFDLMSAAAGTLGAAG
jgi:hypothetical protein